MKKVILMTGVSLIASQVLMAGGDIAPVAPAAENPWSLTTKVGTLGVGVDASRMVSDNTAIRFNINGAQINDIEKSLDGIDFSADANLFSAGVMLDYYPMYDSSFRLSVGGYYDDNNVEATAKNQSNITIDGTTYSNTIVDSVTAKFTANKAVPYLGLGWGKSTVNGWSFSMDIGLFYHGDPDIDVTTKFSTTATAAQKTAVNTHIANYKKSALNTLADYKVYPVVMIGATYKF